MQHSADNRDRARGVLIGLASGDRIGGPLRMALCLAESLIDQRNFDREDIVSRYLNWWNDEGFDAGRVAARVFDLMADGVAGNEAVAAVHAECHELTAGCNPAHRSPPIAMASFLRNDVLADIALGEARVTHFDPFAGDVAAATIMLCRNLIIGMDWPVAISHAAENRDERTRSALLDPVPGSLNLGGFAPDVLRAAVYFVSTNDDFASALKSSIKFAGSSNFPPVLVGAIAGARWGPSSIPAELLAHCTILPRVHSAAESLAVGW